MLKFSLHLILFIFISLADISHAKDIILANENKENFPFTVAVEEGVSKETKGVLIEMLKKAEKGLNIKIKIERMPWKRCLLSVEDGSVDGLTDISFKEERMKLGMYPMKNGKPDANKRIYTNKYVLYTKKDSNIKWDGKNFSNLKGNIGAPAGYSIVDDLRKKNVKIETSPSTKNDIKKLLAGRVEAVAALEYEADNIIRHDKELKKNIKKHKIPLAEKDYYLIFSHQFYKKDKGLAQKIWDEIEKVREKELAQLMRRYYE